MLLTGLLVPLASVAQSVPDKRIFRLDVRFDQLISASARVEKIADGFRWVEGPVWNDREKYLLFSDIPANTVYKWRDGEGVTPFLAPSGYSGLAPFAGREPGSNGLTFDRDGRLVLAEHGDRRIAKLEDGGTQVTLVDRYQGKRLNSPNDLVHKSNGDLYFTDPPFGLPMTFADPAKELPFQGVYRLAANGELTLLTADIKAPNGIAFSPDEKTLYLTDVDPQRQVWLAYEVKNDGTLGNGRVFFDTKSLTKQWNGGPDGLKVDRQGNLFAAGPGGLYVFAPDGTLLGGIRLGVATANCAWGDDGTMLYIAADTAIYRVRTTTRGHVR